MNKFNVNTQGIDNSEIGFFLVQGGKVHCTICEFIDMHLDKCIEEDCGDIVYYYNNEVVEKMGHPVERVSIGKHHPDTLSEDKYSYVPMWEGKKYVCYVDITKQETFVLSDIINGESIQKTVYETEFDFIIESWDENRFYRRKPI